jgi:hypothetical protein
MTETQAQAMLEALLKHVHADMGNDDVPMDEIGYEGPFPDGKDFFTLSDAGLWLFKNIKKVELE